MKSFSLLLGCEGLHVGFIRKRIMNYFRIASQDRNDGMWVSSLRGTKQSSCKLGRWIASQARNDEFIV